MRCYAHCYYSILYTIVSIVYCTWPNLQFGGEGHHLDLTVVASMQSAGTTRAKTSPSICAPPDPRHFSGISEYVVNDAKRQLKTDPTLGQQSKTVVRQNMTTVYSTQHKHAKTCFAFQVTLLAVNIAESTCEISQVPQFQLTPSAMDLVVCS